MAYNGQYNGMINGYYNKLFGRDAKEAGLNFWGGSLMTPSSGITFDNLEQSLINGAQGSDLDYYNEKFLNKKYNDLFERDAAQAGLDYWNDGLKSGAITYDNAGDAILNGASDEDLKRHNNLGNNDPYVPTAPTVPTTPTVPTIPTTPTTPNSPTTPAVMPEVTLQTVTPYIPPEEDLVQGRMNGLLAEGSKYLEAAREAGERTAHGRGLLNSTLAGESAEKAAIEAVLPIAQQDSQSLVSSAIEQHLVNQKTNASSQLSAQEGNQQSVLNDQQNQHASDLADKQAANDLALANANNAAQAARQQVDVELQKLLTNAELTSQEKKALGSSVTVMGQDLNNQIQAIQTNANLTTEAKAEILNQLIGQFQANVSSVSAIYGVPIEWN